MTREEDSHLEPLICTVQYDHCWGEDGEKPHLVVDGSFWYVTHETGRPSVHVLQDELAPDYVGQGPGAETYGNKAAKDQPEERVEQTQVELSLFYKSLVCVEDEEGSEENTEEEGGNVDVGGGSPCEDQQSTESPPVLRLVWQQQEPCVSQQAHWGQQGNINTPKYTPKLNFFWRA